ncbi:MAG: RNA 2',3'-cyclic phosphodiesterase [Candidatus Thermoplasmatota archaeon]|nr:RNA 2',3'-cyclic phosphodiesterase [Candidatus Thermoplasmatota archaeon]MCL5731185.1 RNA 2',3'-cyclic phosphodiesterase [Candidatus Thermoplasmatota archaeon]
MRCFLGIPVEAEQVSTILEQLSRFPELRVVSPENVHMTMIFFGEIGDAESEKVAYRLKEFYYENPVIMHLAGPSCFPEPNKCRIIAMDDLNSDTLMLYRSVLQNISEDPEKRVFRAHVTLARTRAQFKGKLTNYEVKFHARRLVLYRSILRPEGPEYDEIAEAQLI